MGALQCDHNKRVITLTMITLSDFHCIGSTLWCYSWSMSLKFEKEKFDVKGGISDVYISNLKITFVAFPVGFKIIDIWTHDVSFLTFRTDLESILSNQNHDIFTLTVYACIFPIVLHFVLHNAIILQTNYKIFTMKICMRKRDVAIWLYGTVINSVNKGESPV